MKIKIVAFIAGIFGVLGVLLFLVAFGTDYWLLATETCRGLEPANSTHRPEEDGREEWKEKETLTFHHEGFFWRCWFFGEDYKETIWNFWFSEC
ncbi:hypothetical protein lerEdw1_010340 [Lerista edwardsae]|nr:hypothetical protein lerEdw1_010340 [Lerista edwardsae]